MVCYIPYNWVAFPQPDKSGPAAHMGIPDLDLVFTFWISTKPRLLAGLKPLSPMVFFRWKVCNQKAWNPACCEGKPLSTGQSHLTIYTCISHRNQKTPEVIWNKTTKNWRQYLFSNKTNNKVEELLAHHIYGSFNPMGAVATSAKPPVLVSSSSTFNHIYIYIHIFMVKKSGKLLTSARYFPDYHLKQTSNPWST